MGPDCYRLDPVLVPGYKIPHYVGGLVVGHAVLTEQSFADSPEGLDNIAGWDFKIYPYDQFAVLLFHFVFLSVEWPGWWAGPGWLA
jgi:hypothetical protein